MIVTMYIVSYFYPVNQIYYERDAHVIDLKEWKYAKHAAVIIAILTISVYVGLGRFA
jgi:uncharacterized sodium:solute symporter family permease YidK